MGRRDRQLAGTVVGAAALIYGGGHTHHHHHHHGHTVHLGRAAATAISYEKAQLGKPYWWGGTGPDGYDCSGLVWAAEENAGHHGFPRTSEDQYAHLPHTGHPADGDLVFFTGGDGQPSPGHVGLIISARRHLMIEAYATGYPIRVSHYGTATAPPGDGPGDIVGYAVP